ncbi:hypothetical protein NA57DRAFT_80563 [Rhizodiscina lignyota]|uniref:Zn(2)-C6 fungal-type domain-containing protein n=1 Tax=Rhizodiscina lignyota TaxID=1504668 RepID=A0A9P4I329_9PEZI|nr:hypothetical protein NA57DRAFT_80563 [Rhizodiscina lignyota]
MPYRGKRSGSCSVCRQRKIGCGRQRPSCIQCRKSGWTCTGYPDDVDVNFCDETEFVIRKVERQTRKNLQPPTPSPSRPSTPAPEFQLPQISDRGLAFFIHMNIFRPEADKPYMVVGGQGPYEFFPDLFREAKPDGLMVNCMIAVGLASLANAGNSPDWMKQAWRFYGKALGHLREATSDPAKAKADETLVATGMLWMFDMTSGSTVSFIKVDSPLAKMTSVHILALGRLISLRGPEQFRTSIGRRIYLNMRRLILYHPPTQLWSSSSSPTNDSSDTSHIESKIDPALSPPEQESPALLAKKRLPNPQRPMAYPTEVWASWAEPYITEEERPSNTLMTAVERIAKMRDRFKNENMSCPFQMMALLQPIDDMMDEFQRALTSYYGPTSHPLTPTRQQDMDSFYPEYDTYFDRWSASTWLYYHFERAQAHHDILDKVLELNPVHHQEIFIQCLNAIQRCTAAIVRAVPFFLGWNERRIRDVADDENSDRSGPLQQAHSMSGGHALIYQLYKAAQFRPTCNAQRVWIVKQVDKLAKLLGNCYGITMAAVLKDYNEKNIGDFMLDCDASPSDPVWDPEQESP